VDKFCDKGTLESFHRSHLEERMVGILQGGFAMFHGPLDLKKVQGRYDDVFLEGLKLRRVEPLIRTTRAVGSTRGFAYRGFVG
jgi:hypothetical protein